MFDDYESVKSNTVSIAVTDAVIPDLKYQTENPAPVDYTFVTWTVLIIVVALIVVVIVYNRRGVLFKKRK